MQITNSPGATLSNADLIVGLRHLVRRERNATMAVLRLLMEFDTRRLYLGEGYPSMFGYCTQVLHYAEHAAFNRIEVARAARRFPILLDQIAEGALNLTGARLLAPHLTEENIERLIAASRHRTKREIEELIGALKPRPEVAPGIRRLPSSKPVADERPLANPEESTSPAPTSNLPAITETSHRPVVAPLSPERYKVQFTISRETRATLRQVQDLMRHVVPNGDPGVIFERALTILLEQLQRKRCATTSRPRGTESIDRHTRYIPAAARRTVWERDGGRCAFIGAYGRCAERGFLEFHHLVPFAAGGATTAENLELCCRAHNAYEATLFMGAEDVDSVEEGAAPP